MTDQPSTDLHHPDFATAAFDIATWQDEINADRLCGVLLQQFCAELRNQGRDGLEAGKLARGADYFLRDFVIADRRENLFLLPPGRVRQFAGNWYIVRTLEPNLTELADLLAGVDAFYCYCQQAGRISAELAAGVAAECRDLAFFGRRIEDFWAITGDGYQAWEQACPLPK